MYKLKLTSKNYSASIKLLRRFTDSFTAEDGYDIRRGFASLTPSQKRKATIYLKEITSLMARPHTVVRPRRKERLQSLQQFSRHSRKLPNLKVAFVPVADPQATLKVKYKNGKVRSIVEHGNITRREYLFDTPSLIKDPLAEVTHVTDILKGKQYFLMAGEYDIPESVGDSPELVTQAVKRFMSRYSADQYNPDDKNSSYFGNWMRGLIAYDYEQGDAQSFRKHIVNKRKIREILKKLRKLKGNHPKTLAVKKRLLNELKKYRLQK